MAREIMIDLASYQANLTANDYRAIGATKAIVKVTESTNYVSPYIQSEVNNAAAGGVNGFAFYHSDSSPMILEQRRKPSSSSPTLRQRLT